jgi:hypothetical protein
MSDEEKIQLAALGLLGLFRRRKKDSGSPDEEKVSGGAEDIPGVGDDIDGEPTGEGEGGEGGEDVSLEKKPNWGFRYAATKKRAADLKYKPEREKDYTSLSDLANRITIADLYTIVKMKPDAIILGNEMGVVIHDGDQMDSIMRTIEENIIQRDAESKSNNVVVQPPPPQVAQYILRSGERNTDGESKNADDLVAPGPGHVGNYVSAMPADAILGEYNRKMLDTGYYKKKNENAPMLRF